MSRPGYQTDAALRSEVEFLEHLRAQGLPTLSPVRTRAGEPFALAGEHRCLLFEWIPGRRVRRSFNARHARALGELAGRFHAASAAFRPPPGFERQTLDADSLSGEATGFDRVLIRSRLDAESLAVIDRAVEVVRRTWAQIGEREVVHGDLHLANALWVGGEPHLIDFDDMGWAPLAYDLGIAYRECLGHPGGERLWRELVSGYTAIRPLPPGTETHMDELVAARRVFIVMWLTGARDLPQFSGLGDYVAEKLAQLSRIAG